MRKTILIVLLLFAIYYAHGRKLSKSRGTNRGSSRKVGIPQPTSISQPSLARAAQPSAQKPSLFGWQEKSAQRKSSPPRQNPHPQPKQQPKQTQTHSYPSSNTGLSGSGAGKQSYPSSNTGLSGNSPSRQQESIQKSSATQNQQIASKSTNQQSHSYPSSNTGLSGSASGSGYPQQQGGLSGAGAPPPYSAAGGSAYHPQGPPPAYSNSGGYPKQGAGAPPPYSGGNYQHPAPPPPYSPSGGGYGGGYGGYGGGYGHGGYGGYNPMQTPHMPGYFGNYGNNGRSVSRSGNILTGVGIAGAGVGTVLTGLALWNLARSTGHRHNTVIYDNRGQPVAVAPSNSTEPVVDPILGDLVNCTLTISNDNATEVLGIPCAIATSFTPEADLKDSTVPNNPNDNTKCTVTVVTKAGKEFATTIPCSILLSTAAENNVTEPPLIDNGAAITNSSELVPSEGNGPVPIVNGLQNPNTNMSVPYEPVLPTALPFADSVNNTNSNITCIPEQGEIRDPINPCYSVTTDLTVIPLANPIESTTPPSA